MNRSWAAEHPVDEQMARSLIEAQFPALAPVRLKLLGAGWDNTAYRVNGAQVFRFPRRQIAVDLLESEVQGVANRRAHRGLRTRPGGRRSAARGTNCAALCRFTRRFGLEPVSETEMGPNAEASWIRFCRCPVAVPRTSAGAGENARFPLRRPNGTGAQGLGRR